MSLSVQEARSIVRKAVKRVPEGETIRHLNIMPMMDMMTILLVAFIFQMTSSAGALQANTVSLPTSTSQEELPVEGAMILTISKKAILIEQERIVDINKKGDVDASDLQDGNVLSNKIPNLTKALGALRSSNEAEAARNKEAAPKPELIVIADAEVKYGVLLKVFFSARDKEAGFKQFRLVVVRPETEQVAQP